IADIETVEQVSPVGRDRLCDGFRRSRADQALECRHIDRNLFPIERYALALGDYGRGMEGAERLLEPGDRRLQAVARLLLATVAPQQPSQPIARMPLARRQGQDGEQRALLPPGDIDRDPGGARLEFTEQIKLQRGHGRCAPWDRPPGPTRTSD